MLETVKAYHSHKNDLKEGQTLLRIPKVREGGRGTMGTTNYSP